MNYPIYPFLVVVLLIGAQGADVGPTEGLAQLQTDYQAMRELKMAPLRELQNKYRNKLNALLEEAKSAGNLDAALAIRKELDGFLVRPTDPQEDVAPELAQAQRVYLTHKGRVLDGIGKDLSTVDMRYLEQLDALEKKLTQAGDLSSALRVRQAGAAIRKEMAAPLKAPSSTLTSGPIRRESIDALKSDLVAYWPFDRDCNDRKARHDGVIKGSGITFAEGQVGKAVRLTQDCYIAIPHHTALNLNHPFTIALWITLDNADGRPNYNRSIISKSFAAWILYIETKKNLCFRVEGSGTLVEPKVPLDQIPEGKWTHIAATFDRQEAKLYVNGTEAAAQKSASPFVPNVHDGVEVRFGSSVTHWFWWFYGIMDEVRIYKKALTDIEINALVASSAPLGQVLSDEPRGRADGSKIGVTDAEPSTKTQPQNSPSERMAIEGSSWRTPAGTLFRFEPGGKGNRSFGTADKTTFAWRQHSGGIVEVTGEGGRGGKIVTWFFRFEGPKKAYYGANKDTISTPLERQP